MNLPRLKILVGAILLASATPSAADVQTPERLFCEAEVPVTFSIAEHRARIRNHRFHCARYGGCWGAFYFENLWDAPVQGVALVLSYHDERGAAINEIAYAAATEQAQRSFRAPVSVENPDELKNEMASQDGAVVQGLSHIVSTECPAQAKVTFMFVQFSRGETLELRAPGWKVGPLLNLFPRKHLYLPQTFLRGPRNVLCKLGVNAQGRISYLIPQTPEGLEVARIVREEIADWLFFPALADGKPVDAEFEVLLRIYGKGSSYLLDRNEIPYPLVVISLIPEEGPTGQWEVWYGHRRGGTCVK